MRSAPRKASLLAALSALVLGSAACGEAETTPPETPPLVFGTTTLADAPLGRAYSQALTASGGKSPYTFSVTAGALPAGLTLEGSTIQGTPTAPGRVTLTIELRDAQPKTLTKELTLYVVPAPLVVSTSSLSSGSESTAYAGLLEAEGGIEPYEWSVSAGVLPAGLTLAADGTLEGTPTTAGGNAFTVQVKDAEQKTATRDLMLTIRPLLPMITTSTLPRGQTGVMYDAQLAVGSGHAPYTWSLAMGMLPRNVNIDPTTGRITGRPTVSGVYRFTVRATDARMRTDEAELALVVLAPLSIATRALPAGVLNRPYRAELMAAGGLAPYTWVISGTLPMGLTATPDGVIAGTPTQGGDFALTVRVADDAGGVRSTMYTLSVNDLIVYTSTPAQAFPPVCSVPGNPTSCVPWTQQQNAVCTSTQVSYQAVDIPVSESFAIESLAVDVDVDFTDAGRSYNTGNALNNRNLRLKLVLMGPDGRTSVLCGNANGHRQEGGCDGTGGVATSYPSPTRPETPLTVFNGTNARGTWKLLTSVAWPTVDQNGSCHQGGTVNSVTLTFRVDRGTESYVTLGGFAYNNLIQDPWVRIAGGNQVANNNSIQLTATRWDVGPNGFREGGQGDDVPQSAAFTFTGLGLPAGTTVTPSGVVTGGDDTGTAQVRLDDGAGTMITRRLLIVPPDWNRKVRDF